MKPSAASITLWPFYDAPDEYRELSPHGGDEDWIMFVPDELLSHRCGHSTVAFQLDRIRQAIGVCDTSDHRIEGGTIFIGAHA